ncbi:MAG: multidrug DMT transporter permease [Bryobacteraceae bacterium]|jgi:glucose uptake protein
MVLPQTYLAALLLMILTMICWGSWVNTFKLAGKWRFELFYWDFILGAALAAALAAVTFGTLGFDGFLFTDDLMRAGKRNIVYGMGAGAIFNLGNMLLLAAVSVAGMSVALPVGLGLGLIVAAIWGHASHPESNPTMLLAGLAIVLAAIVVNTYAYRRMELAKARLAIKAGKGKGTVPKTSWKATILSAIGGLLMGSIYPLVEFSQKGDAGLGPYAMAFVFAAGIFFSTFIFNLFFMNLTVQGEPVEILDYLRGTWKQHGLGVLGGMVWATGTIASFVVASAPEARLGPAMRYGLGQSAAVVGALWGLLAWKEFRGADVAVRILMGVMLILFAGGVTLAAVARLYP